MSKSNPESAGGGAGAARRMKPDERREQILAAALPCFAARGYAGAGTRDLARAAGITEPILYRHFAGKADLFRAVLERIGDRLAGAVAAAVAGARGADRRLKALAGAFPHILDVHRDDLRVLNAAALAHEEPGIRDAARDCAQRVGNALAASFRGSGLRRGVRAVTAGFLLLEVGMGAAMLRPLTLPEMEPKDFADRVASALLGGIAG